MRPCRGDIGQPCQWQALAYLQVLGDDGEWLDQCDECVDICARNGLTTTRPIPSASFRYAVV